MNWLQYRAAIYLVAVGGAVAFDADPIVTVALGISMLVGTGVEYYRRVQATDS